MSNNHEQVIKTRARTPRASCEEPRPAHRDDPFARLVAAVAADPANAYNLDGYLWVLEEPAPRPCALCGSVFDPGVSYCGELAQGLPRRYCRPACANRAAYRRHRAKAKAGMGRAAA